MRNKNPYYHSYKQLRQVELEQNEKAKLTGNKMPSIHMAFKRHYNDDPRRYNIPKVGEIAAVFTGDAGLAIHERDFQVFPKTNDPYPLTKLNVLSQHISPMTYPLFHLNGDPVWRPGIEHNEKFRY